MIREHSPLPTTRHAKSFETVVTLTAPPAEALEALEGALPAGVIEHGARGGGEPAEGGDDEAEAGGASVLGPPPTPPPPAPQLTRIRIRARARAVNRTLPPLLSPPLRVAVGGRIR